MPIFDGLDRCTRRVADLIRRAGEWVIYRRGSASRQLRCLPIRPRGGMILEGPSEIDYEEMEWQLVAADLFLEGRPVEPQPGDRLYRNVKEKGPEIFEVLPRAGQPCGRRVDSQGRILAITTKRITD